MCEKNEAIRIGEDVAERAKTILGQALSAVVLYGSYARGDYDDESDIDIMVRIDCTPERLNELRETFIGIANELSLEHGVEVSVSLADAATYDRYKRFLPYYESIESEGIKIA
ncbi:MAG: nucleotidyltransferase domain-containing protein [Clostridia bacterium]|nr:nucleotidyltransferase domain-containing protein [Clostridia bacterium]